MKWSKGLLTAVAAALILSGCAAGLHTQHLQTANFTTYQTFYWLKPIKRSVVENPIIDSEILTERVRSATVETLTSHGYTRVPNSQRADFVVSYGVSTEVELRGTTYGAGYGFAMYPFYPGIYYPGYYFACCGLYSTSYTSFDTYKKAHLIINVMDAQTHQLVWRGWNTMRLTDENFSREHIFEVVQTILTRFPPPESAASM